MGTEWEGSGRETCMGTEWEGSGRETCTGTACKGNRQERLLVLVQNVCVG